MVEATEEAVRAICGIAGPGGGREEGLGFRVKQKLDNLQNMSSAFTFWNLEFRQHIGVTTLCIKFCLRLSKGVNELA